MREKTYHLYLNEEERSRVIQSLIELKNNLAASGTIHRRRSYF